MPLTFESLSHGKIAFGFFNIETDMILLDTYFLFAQDFCQAISEVSEKHENDVYETALDIYLIEQEAQIGDLMRAIHGIDHRGFIGEVYKLFPFPENQEGFKQNPEGFKNRVAIDRLVQKYGKRCNILFKIDPKMDQVHFGEYVFNRASFRELIQYLWQGGQPQWKDNSRPDYLLTMKAKIDQSKHFLFEGLMLR